MADRLATGYNRNSSKKKYLGYTELFVGDRVPKSDNVCEFNSAVWQLRLQAATVLESFQYWIDPTYLGENKDLYACKLLKWIIDHSFSLSAYAYNKGNTDKRYITENHVKQLQQAISFYKKEVEFHTGKAYTDFVRYDNDEYGRQIEQLNIYARTVEREYVRWLYDTRTVADFYQHMKDDPVSAVVRFERMNNTLEFLNELSNFMFWMLRYHSMRYFLDRDLEVEVLEWDSSNTTLPDIYD